MIKKNQFALIFLTVITMLAVWYIKTPATTPENEIPTGGDPSTERLAEIVEMREAIRAERSITAMSLDAIIADEEATLASKENAIAEKKALSALTEKEVLLELQVMNKGYEDAFVHSTSNGVEVLVVSDESSAALANEIIQMTLAAFENAESVVVDFKTVDEIQNP